MTKTGGITEFKEMPVEQERNVIAPPSNQIFVISCVSAEGAISFGQLPESQTGGWMPQGGTGRTQRETFRGYPVLTLKELSADFPYPPEPAEDDD
jgi:hypothetical protein